VLQRHQRGLGEYNPIRQASRTYRAWKIFLGKGAAYQEMQKLGLFQSPGLPTFGTSEELIDVAVRGLRSDLGKWGKAASVASQQIQKPLPGNKAEWATAVNDFASKVKNGDSKAISSLVDAMLVPYRAMGTLTWAGDEILRIESYLTATERTDMTNAEAAKYVSDAHGAYASLSHKYQKAMSRIFFVHSFRILMPTEVAKSMYTVPVMAAQTALGKKSYTASQWKLATKAMTSTMLFPIIVHQLMKLNDWEPEEEGLPEALKFVRNKVPIGLPFPTYKNHWKYKKMITLPTGEKREIVIGVSTILNMLPKWLERLTKDRPEKLDDMFYHVTNVFKWEVNPMYRIILDIATNESSFGGKRPTDRDKSIDQQVRDVTAYAFSNVFRMYNTLSRGNDDTAYQKQVRDDLDKSLNGIEKVLLGYYTGYTRVGVFNPVNVGYSYTRAERRRRFGFAVQNLKRSISKEIGIIKREDRDDPSKMRDRIRTMKVIERERTLRLKKIYFGGKI